MLWVILVIVAVLVLLVVWIIAMYNGLVRLRNRIDSAWSRTDVIPLQVVENVEDRVEVQILLRLEIPIDRALADPGFGGDIIDQDIMEILGRKDFSCSSEDLSLFSSSLGSRHIDSDTDRSVSISHTGPALRGFRGNSAFRSC